MSWSCRIVAAVCLQLGALAQTQCRSENPEAAFLAGDFLEARKHYNAKECASLSGAPAQICQERVQQIGDALAGAARYLGRRANDNIRHGKQIQYNRYGEAIRNLELALVIMADDDPSRADYVAAVERIRTTLASLENELNQQLNKLSAMLETGTYDPKVWTEIRLTFERVRVLLLAIGKEDERPRKLARDFVDKFYRHGQYEHARIATQLTDAVIAAGRPARHFTDRELILFGVIDHLGQQQQETRQEKIEGLAQEVREALESKKKDIAIKKAHLVLDLGATGKIAGHMGAILEQLEGRSGQQQRAGEARKVVAETQTDIAPVPLAAKKSAKPTVDVPNPQPTPNNAGAVVSAPAKQQPVAVALKEILRQYEQKDLYPALTGLEDLSQRRCSSRERRQIDKLRRIWTPDRQRLINDIVKEADRLFVLMDESCLAEYVRARRLNPEGTTADHIKKRIDTLERILED